MKTKNPILTRALKRALYSAVTVPVIFMAPGALAQDQASAPEEQVLEEIIVTGSRIARDPNIGANAPVQSISADDIQLSGVVDLGEILNDLPALLGSSTSTNSVFGVFGTGSGETAGSSEVGETVLQLRGLGVERTLVLVNGRRHVSGVGGSQAVDIGSIPTNLIERVEVLTGGASAVYGADAVTGVVNFIMKEDYEGLNFNFMGGISGDGDGENYSASALFGKNFDNGRGNFTFSVSFTQREAIFHGDRAFSRNNGIGSDDQNPARRFQTGDIDAAGTPNFARFYSPSTAFASSSPPCDLFGYNYCYGFHPVGFPILSQSEFTDLWRMAFPGEGDPVLTQAELDLINRAASAPTRLISSGHNFSLSSNGGVLLPGGLFQAGIDIDGDGVNDCNQSFQGFISTYSYSPPAIGFIGGCWIIEDNGNVRPLVDGLIAGDINQFGADGIADWSDEDMLLPDDKKYSFNATGHYDLTDAANLFFEAKYVRQETVNTSPLTTFWDLLTIAPDNPYLAQLPPALEALGQAEGLFITRDPNDLGPSNDKSTRETFRFVVGLEGDMPNGWNYEVSANYGKFEQKFEDRNRVIVDRFFAAIDAVADSNGNPICRSDVDPTPPPTTPFEIPAFDPGFFTFNPGDGQCSPANILGGVGAISQQAIDFITQTVVNRFETDQLVFSAIITGDTGDMFSTSAGPVSFAIGVEYRDEKSKVNWDPLVRGVLPVTTAFGQEGQLLSDIFAGVSGTQRSLVFDSESLIQNITGSYDVKEIFGEISVPILQGRQFAEDLTLDAAVRYSDYSTVGSTLTWNVGGSWTPFSDSFRLRGSYSVAVRAPNIDELFSPSQGAFFRPVDPCDRAEISALNASGDPRGPIRAANCLAAGISPGFSDPLTARFVGETSGNPDLIEEEAETFSVGFILQPEFLSGLTVTVDYWDIDIKDAIDAPSAQSIVNGCYDSLQFPDNQFCDLIRRNDDPTSPQFNGLEFIRQQQLNIGKLVASGFDFAVRYQFAVQAAEVSLGIAGTKMEKIDRFFDPSNPAAVDPELGELQRPEWGGNFNATVGIGRVNLKYNLQYLGEQALRDVEIETVDVLYGPAGIADETFVHNISFSVDLNESYQIYGGVNNIGNERPFLTELAFPVSPLGRYFFLGLNANF
ncbi:MAG: TonB-dependent receptor [Proteobacteria bacterium]|nr:TonB-dependent receptor [Pseudomonadota bacterium]